MQLLLKQSTSAVDVLSDVFKLTEEEKKRLANFPIGQGLFFCRTESRSHPNSGK